MFCSSVTVRAVYFVVFCCVCSSVTVRCFLYSSYHCNHCIVWAFHVCIAPTAVDAGGVKRRLDDICMQFMQVKDAYLHHAAALMKQSAPPAHPTLSRKRKVSNVLVM